MGRDGDVKGRIAFVWIISIISITIIIVCVALLRNHERIALPVIEQIQLIEMEQVNEGTSLGLVTLTDKDDIGIILSNLNGRKKTIMGSVHDAPIQSNYLFLRLMLIDERKTLYLYADGGRYYIEEPYVGIYKSDREASVAIYGLYN